MWTVVETLNAQKNMFYCMLPTVSKYGEYRGFLVGMFKIKASAFNKIVYRFLNIAWEVFYKLVVERLGRSNGKWSQYL